MATVKLILEKHEDEDEARELLLKALSAQTSGDLHEDAFSQPLAQKVVEEFMAEYRSTWDKILKEIEAVLDDH